MSSCMRSKLSMVTDMDPRLANPCHINHALVPITLFCRALQASRPDQFMNFVTAWSLVVLWFPVTWPPWDCKVTELPNSELPNSEVLRFRPGSGRWYHPDTRLFNVQRSALQHSGHSSFFTTLFTMASQHNQLQVPNFRLRILIIGRANAGKTTILKRVCQTTKSPKVYRLDQSGQRSEVCPRSW